MAKSKGLSTERAEAAREYIRALVDRDFGGIVWAFTRKLGIAQASISTFLASKAGIGLNVLEKIADYAGCTIDEVVGRSGMPQGRDLDALERLLLERLAELRMLRLKKTPSGFPPPMLPPAQPNVIAMQGQSRHRKKSSK